ncbi:ATP-dependent helicase [bacterium]|nr:ATP-dependent helicase [bacterium]NBX97967.1 ATP-dependent helicase [bacterium]NDC94417.1 ATP-dependent helicase [bacterium]NDD83551.1 ATP-dependent helicase [bacterium]NDG30580.1 ATP-dependent helicase [bacterium]
MGFTESYQKLNSAQRAAVDTIQGPLLVVAGPGTGKTQLLATRIANILKLTDTPAQNILCLTFTESAALNMQERLMEMIGNDAYDVKISTYHSFGSDIIRTYPEYFESLNIDTNEESRLERPIDELAKHQIVLNIVKLLPYDNPLKSTQYHVGDLINTISELKRGLLGPKELRTLAASNLKTIESVSPIVNKSLVGITKMPTKFDTSLQLFMPIHKILATLQTELAKLGYLELEEAVQQAQELQKSAPLTKWKNKWLHKTASNTWSFTDPKLSHKLTALAGVLEAYTIELNKRGLYDFDDMILRAIAAMKQNDELRYNLQEKYLYVLLDEFQDTNAAQFELVKQLTNNPISEGRPNVMAVGDDDQAIFAFQGAEVGNIVEFVRSYTDVTIINLTQNYRSHGDIIFTAQQVSGQIKTGLNQTILSGKKTLQAGATTLPPGAQLGRYQFVDRPNEYTWVANQIAELARAGENLNDIAVLAPRHKYLEAIVPFLNNQGIAVSYEKRENILQAPIVQQLKTMSELVLSLHQQDHKLAAYYFAIVLSHPSWNVPIDAIWRVNWKAGTDTDNKPWLEVALDNKEIRQWVLFFMTLAGLVTTTPLEKILDYLTGSEPLQVGSIQITSPIKDYFFDTEQRTSKPQNFFETLTQLSVIREKLRDYQITQEHMLMLSDFVLFFAMYDAAEQPLLNTHPVSQSDNAVQLMTTYKAKGLEFGHVFLLSLHDSVWGPSAQGNNNKLALPPNLKHIRYAGSNEDELLRLFFVAITRAKTGLYLTSHERAENGKKIIPLKFLLEIPNDQTFTTGILPTKFQQVVDVSALPMQLYQQAIELQWHAPHSIITPTLKSLLKKRLDRYAMSPTHVNTFIDLQYGGPVTFLLNTLLRFPKAPTNDGVFGNVMHEVLDWYCRQLTKPNQTELLKYLQLRLRHYFKDAVELDLLLQRGTKALQAFIAQRGQTIGVHDISEHNFADEGVVVNDVHLSGRIDRMIVDKKTKTIKVVDYKTGESFTSWKHTIKLLKYRQQLCIYKLLIEASHTYRGYTVTEGILEFVEPDEDGTCRALTMEFSADEMNETKRLVTAIWHKIHTLDLPDVSGYDKTYAGVQNFIKDLVTNN